VQGLLDRSLDGDVATTTVELAATLLEKIKIAVVPGEAFGTPGFFRLSCALGDEDLAEGLERFAKFVAAG
jgi:aspartate/methionine/tyrosine aminotransferase